MNAYEQMLSLLGENETVAGERYIVLRGKLIMYFEGRRISPAEDHADEVLHRIAKKISQGEIIKDIDRYVFGVARFVMLEAFQHPRNVSIDEIVEGGGPLPLELTSAALTEDVDEVDATMQSCLRKCLAQLRPDQQKLLRDYYEIDEASGNHIEQRKQLAMLRNSTPGALQKQICLLRKKVSRCAHECLAREAGK